LKDGRIVVEKMVGITTFDEDTKKEVWSTKQQFGADKVNLTFDFGTKEAIVEGNGPVTVEGLCEAALRSYVILLQGAERRTSIQTGRYSVAEGKTISVADLVTQDRRTGTNRQGRDRMVAAAVKARIVERMIESGMTEEEAQALVG